MISTYFYTVIILQVVTTKYSHDTVLIHNLHFHSLQISISDICGRHDNPYAIDSYNIESSIQKLQSSLI